MTPTKRLPSGAAVLRPRLTEAVTEAVLDELAGCGYARLSMQRVAARAGVGKSALYRRWSDKPSMVMDAVSRFGVPDEPPPDTGSLLGDLEQLARNARDWLAHPRLAPIVVDLLAESRRSPELASSFNQTLAGPRRKHVYEVLARARDRGEIPELDPSSARLVVDVVASVPFWRLALDGISMDDHDVSALAHLLTRAVTT